MQCPFCKTKETKVIDKRDSEDGTVSRRRRECTECKNRFTTYEKIESLSIKVVKSDGTLQDYDRSKLISGVGICAQKRLSSDEIEKFVDDIEMAILNRKSTKISSSDIGRLVLNKLKEIDKVAYLRFASVFLEFEDVNEFKDELKKLE